MTHKGYVWSKEREFALAFGTALGLSASQIARSMGDVTRNAIIGKWHRLKMRVPQKEWYQKFYPRQERPPMTEEQLEQRRAQQRAQIIAARAARGDIWTKEEDDILEEAAIRGARMEELIQLLPGRNVGAIRARKHGRGYCAYSLRRFTPEDDAIIRADYIGNVEVTETAKRLGRSVGVLRQRIMFLGLHRDGRKVRLAKKWGHDVLSLSDDPAEIQHIMLERGAAERAERDAAYAAKVEQALDAMDAALARGEDRRLSFQAAMLAGATLQQVGLRQGITRERVRQVVSQVRSGKGIGHPYVSTDISTPIPCRKCGNPFVRTIGQQRYCSDLCRIAAMHHPFEQTIPCKQCGVEFLSTHRKRKFCGPVCAYENQRQVYKDRYWAKANAEATQPEPPPEPKPAPVQSRPKPKAKRRTKHKPKPQPHSLRRQFLR